MSRGYTMKATINKEKGGKMSDKAFNLVMGIFLGLGISCVVFAIVSSAQQTSVRVRVNDGRSVQVDGDTIYYTYVEELDETK